jgi:hypothetical protein
MTFWVAGAVVVGAGVNAYASNKAAKAQQQSASDANAVAKQTSDDQIALQREMFNKNVELQQPAIDAGNTSRNRLLQLLGLSAGGADNGSLMKDFSMGDFQADPGYQFRLDQGQKALDRSAAARGSLLSGAALKDANNYAQGQASQELQAAYDRFNTNRTNKMNPLLSLAGSAQTASGALGAAGQNYANGAGSALSQYGAAVGQNLTGAGNARASGYVGTANAVGNGLSQYLNYNQNQNLLSKLSSNSSVGGYNDEMARINAQLYSGG